MKLQMYYALSSRLLLSLLISIFFFFTANAQVLRRDTVPPKREVEVIRFGEAEGSRTESNRIRRSIIKTAPFSFILGYLPLYYEYEVVDWLGIQGGIGLTFKPQVSQLLAELYTELNDHSCDGSIDCGNYRDYSYRTSKPGLMFALSPRLYFASDGMDGSYIAPEIRILQRRAEAQQPDPFNYPERLENSFDTESIRLTDLMVNFGWQTLFPKLSLDYSLGAGIRQVSGSWQQVSQDANGDYFSSTPIRKESNFRFDIGLRIGFQL